MDILGLALLFHVQRLICLTYGRATSTPLDRFHKQKETVSPSHLSRTQANSPCQPLARLVPYPLAKFEAGIKTFSNGAHRHAYTWRKRVDVLKHLLDHQDDPTGCRCQKRTEHAQHLHASITKSRTAVRHLAEQRLNFSQITGIRESANGLAPCRVHHHQDYLPWLVQCGTNFRTQTALLSLYPRPHQPIFHPWPHSMSLLDCPSQSSISFVTATCKSFGLTSRQRRFWDSHHNV